MRHVPAHLGHLGETATAAGTHDHWVAGAAIAGAAAAALWGWLGRRGDEAPEAEDDAGDDAVPHRDRGPAA